MGTHYVFECSDCKYSTATSDGRDVGMMAVTKTMVCRGCTEVVDVMIGQFGQDGPTGDPEFDKQLGVCPLCNDSDLRAWPRRHPCPKCKSPMIKDESSEIDWD